jgi:miniconductance mechanosensitive channel
MDVESLRSLANDPLVRQLTGIAVLIAACLVAHFATRRWIVRGIEKLTLRSASAWDDALHETEVFRRLAGLVPALIAWYGIQLVPDVGEEVEIVVGRVAFAAILVVGARSLSGLLAAANLIYSRRPEHVGRPIKGYVQVAQILVAVVTAVLIVATLLDRSPLVFLSGIGAMTAVLLLIFRDTILSLVASIQITGNDLVRRGDWIEMPQYGADGDVIDVALHTVKVQNWDKTVTTIPTHKLIEDAFKNWRFMSLSGGRRIKRALFIDVRSVRFLEENEIDGFAELSLLRDYVAEKRREIGAWNTSPDRNSAHNADIRRLTNLGTFRAYIERYLRAHPRIHQGMTLMVRQLAPGPTGIPIELYCFTNTTDWVTYEGIQSDIFDHLLAIASEFGLQAFQNPSGADLVDFASRAVGR